MPRYDAVLFDLLTALLDSWTLWNAVAGDEDSGRRWRAEYLRITYTTGTYRPYEDLVAEAAEAVGLDRSIAAALDARYGQLQPWPDVVPTLGRLSAGGMKLGVVTNCSRRLGRIASGRIDAVFDCVVTAEEAGCYKPDPRTYRLALDKMSVTPDRCLFVAGSAYDLMATAKVGLAIYWHDRVGMEVPSKMPPPLAHERTLAGLPGYLGIA
jgi:2-haloalkanoic acid dehalogenase type II